jgi:prepilin peptidase CpaA
MTAATNIVLVIAALYCAYTDVRYRRIYNYITIPAIVLGVLIQYLFNGIDGLTMSLLGTGTGLGLFLLFYLLKGIGGGDIKLLAAVGALQGYIFVVYTAAMAVLLAGSYVLIHAARKGMLGMVLRSTCSFILSPGKTIAHQNHESMTIPLGFFIGLSSLVMLVIQYLLPLTM